VPPSRWPGQARHEPGSAISSRHLIHRLPGISRAIAAQRVLDGVGQGLGRPDALWHVGGPGRGGEPRPAAMRSFIAVEIGSILTSPNAAVGRTRRTTWREGVVTAARAQSPNRRPQPRRIVNLALCLHANDWCLAIMFSASSTLDRIVADRREKISRLAELNCRPREAIRCLNRK